MCDIAVRTLVDLLSFNGVIKVRVVTPCTVDLGKLLPAFAFVETIRSVDVF